MSTESCPRCGQPLAYNVYQNEYGCARCQEVIPEASVLRDDHRAEALRILDAIQEEPLCELTDTRRH